MANEGFFARMGSGIGRWIKRRAQWRAGARSVVSLASIALATVMISDCDAATNGHGARLSAVSTQRVGLKSAWQPSGCKVTVAVSPYPSKHQTSPSGVKIVVGPAAVMMKAARVARSRHWNRYE